MAVVTRLVEYELDGQSYDGFVAVDDAQSGQRPGVMVCHAWGGRKDHEEDAARRLAELGYVGFAADIYGIGKRGNDMETCQALMTPLVEDRDLLRRRLLAALGQMKALDEVDVDQAAVSGYCLGGLSALDMARVNAPVRGVVAFHCIFGSTEDAEKIEPKILALQGYDDPLADADAQRIFTDEMTRREADWQLHLYGGVTHAFTNQDANEPELGLKYNVNADARSWTAFENFLAELFG